MSLIYNETNNISNKSISYKSLLINKFFKQKIICLLSEIISSKILNFLNYLSLIDLCQLRVVSKNFLLLINNYYPERLNLEIDLILNYQNLNKEYSEIYMKNIDNQIPISKNNWLDFDLASVLDKIFLLNKDIIQNIKSIKNLGKYSDNIFAPFCILLGKNKLYDLSIKHKSWKYIAFKILNDPIFLRKIENNLEIENYLDRDILESFTYLNNPQLDYNYLKYYSNDLAKLILWCQGIVSYHILIHPYIYRNKNCKIEKNVLNYIKNINLMINRFYKFKRFLFNITKIKLPLDDYIFNLQHNRQLNDIKHIYDNLNFDKRILGNILSYLPSKEVFKYNILSKKMKNGFIESIKIKNEVLMRALFNFKKKFFQKFYNKISIIYECNLFSKYFLMLDDILNSKINLNENFYIPFFTKTQINYILNLKSNNKNQIIHKIIKLFCLIFDIQPKKHIDFNGIIKYEYYNNIKNLIINKKFEKLIRKFNKLNISNKILKIIHRELSYFMNNYILDEIKKINIGIYNMLLYEIFIFEFNKNFNPIVFIDENFLLNNLNKDEIKLIKFYNNILNELKYNLNISYKFSNSYLPFYNFKKYYRNFEDEKYYEILFKSKLNDYEKISNVYFNSKDLINYNKKFEFYEKIIREIININYKPKKILFNFDNEKKLFHYLKNNINEEEEKKFNFIRHNKVKSCENIFNLNKLFINDNLDNQNKFNNNKKINNNNNNNNSNYLLIPNEIIIKHILFYLDINNLSNFSLINKKSNICLKTHIFIRLFCLNIEKEKILNKYKNIIDSINNKKLQFYKDYNLKFFTVDEANYLINYLTKEDLLNIKKNYRNYLNKYENLIIPFLYLINKKLFINKNLYKIFFDILNDKNIIKKISNFELETLPKNIYFHIEKILRENIDEKKLKFLPIPIFHLINWVKGVIAFHNILRKFSLNEIDLIILNEDEINFCNEMDAIDYINYKLIRYASNYCSKYEKKAKEIMKEMNLK